MSQLGNINTSQKLKVNDKMEFAEIIFDLALFWEERVPGIYLEYIYV